MIIQKNVATALTSAIEYVELESLPALEKRNKTLASYLKSQIQGLKNSLVKEFLNQQAIDTTIQNFKTVISDVSQWHVGRGANRKAAEIAKLIDAIPVSCPEDSGQADMPAEDSATQSSAPPSAPPQSAA